jgi:hypothetical protein
MISFRQCCSGFTVLLAMFVMCSCQDRKTKMVNEVVHNDPKIRERAIAELRQRPDPDVLKKLIAKYEHETGEARLRAGHALLEATDSINKKSKGEKDDDARWGGVSGQADAKTGNK